MAVAAVAVAAAAVAAVAMAVVIHVAIVVPVVIAATSTLVVAVSTATNKRRNKHTTSSCLESNFAARNSTKTSPWIYLKFALRALRLLETLQVPLCKLMPVLH